jgi:hypothetical protein
MPDLSSALHLAAPELTLAIGALVLLVLGAFIGEKSARLTLDPVGRPADRRLGHRRHRPAGRGLPRRLCRRSAGRLRQGADLSLLSAVAILGGGWMQRAKIAKFEYPILIVLASVGHEHDGLVGRPDLALRRYRAAFAGPLRPGRLPPRRPQGLGSRPEVFRPRRPVVGPAAVRRQPDLRLHGFHAVRGHRRRRHRPSRRRPDLRSGVPDLRSGLQGLGRAVPHVDARRLRRRPDPGRRLVRHGPQGRGHGPDRPRPGTAPSSASMASGPRF